MTKGLEFRHPVRYGKYFDCAGRKSIIMGTEEGKFEVWVYPVKICSGLQFFIKNEDLVYPVPLCNYAEEIIIKPSGVEIVFCGDLFNINLKLYAPVEEGGIVLIVEPDFSIPHTLLTGFIPQLKPMWPHGIGGQYITCPDELDGFLISEGEKEYNGVICSPGAKPVKSSPAHELPSDLVFLELKQYKDRKIPVVIAGGVLSREKTFAVSKKLIKGHENYYSETVRHFENICTNYTSVHSSDGRVDCAFEWAKVAFDRCIVTNPHLGTGLVAGLGLSGKTERPGFGWFFGGDTFINSPAITSYGDFENLKKTYRLLAGHQRDDGKMPHEISQSADMISWFDNYPYAYIHADTTPFYIISAGEYIRTSGDLEFLKESWDSVKKAYNFCRKNDRDNDGLMENTSAGLGASELGSLREGLLVDVYLASLSTKMYLEMSFLSEIMEETGLKASADILYRKSQKSLLEKFFDKKNRKIVYGISVNGDKRDEVTAWAAVPLMLNLFSYEKAVNTLNTLASYELSTDWGVRMLSCESKDYSPAAYNNGAVWPFLTGLACLAEYRYHRYFSAFDHYMQLVHQTETDSKGLSTELLSGDFFVPVSTSVPHQLFSSAPVIYTLLKGVLGMEPDAINDKISFTPHMPEKWKKINVANIPFKNCKINYSYRKYKEKVIYSICKNEDGKISAVLSPGFAPFTQCNEVLVNGISVEYKKIDYETDVHYEIFFELDKNTVIEYRIEPGIILSPEIFSPSAGSRTKNLKITDHIWFGNRYQITVEGIEGTVYQIPVCQTEYSLEIEGAELKSYTGGEKYIEIKFEKSSKYYLRKIIKFTVQNFEIRA